LEKSELQVEDLERSTQSTMVIVFSLGREKYGVPIELVKEIVPKPVITAVPQPPKYILGVVNVRGTVYAVLDLASKISVDEKEKGSHLVVLNLPDMQLVLMVEGIPQARLVEDESIDRESQVVAAHDHSFISGLIKEDGEVIILLDLQTLAKSI